MMQQKHQKAQEKEVECDVGGGGSEAGDSGGGGGGSGDSVVEDEVTRLDEVLFNGRSRKSNHNGKSSFSSILILNEIKTR